MSKGKRQLAARFSQHVRCGRAGNPKPDPLMTCTMLPNPLPRAASVPGLIAILVLLCLAPARARVGNNPSVALYYGDHPPVAMLHDFDWVVVQPDTIAGPGTLDGPHTTVFAYVSLGEAGQSSTTAQTLPAKCRIGENRVWKSLIIDQATASCRDWYLEHVFKPLWARGFRHFFFDTLDSYQLVLRTPAQRAAYRQGLIALIEAVHRRDPQGTFILNRGFELIDALRGQGVVGVAAESLYQGWSQKTGRYVPVKPADTQWLLGQFRRVRELGLVPIAIDYLPPAKHHEAEQLARRIARRGIVPYVTDRTLNIIGTGSVTPLPRRVLMLYDGPYEPMNNIVDYYAAMPLNHMGYVTREIDVDHQPLPQGPLTGQVAGIVTWFASDHFPHSAETWRWLSRQIEVGVPVAVLDHFGFPLDVNHLAALGLRSGEPVSPGLHAAQVSYQRSGYFSFESPLIASGPDFTPLRLRDGTPLLTVSVAGRHETGAALTPWGGYALDPYVLRNLPQGDLENGEQQAAWILDPFHFFKAALRLPDIPAYDTTTASGRRLLFGLVDGDGFASGSWIGSYHDKLAAKVILDAVLNRFPLPVTVSVIASEFTTNGLHPAEIARLRSLARAIYRLPWVEMGSHTYSHPFDWRALEHDPNLSAGLHLKKNRYPKGAYVAGDVSARDRPKLKYGYNLPVPGYRFSLEQEITGSTWIIDRYLAPPGKRVGMIQWSGDSNPDRQALRIADRDGLANINGNNSTIDRAHPSLTNVAPLGVWKGPYFQVYSPIANEDEYTYGWRSPYCGYDKAIQTMRMTNRPRRLTPIEIYYHFYSGTRACGLKDLIKVYQWATAQPSAPAFASTYSHIAVAFTHAGLARTENGYLLRGYGTDQELRIPAAMGYPDLDRSLNISGFDTFNGQRYIHLGPGDEARLVLSKRPPGQPYLVSTNGLVEALARKPGRLTLHLRAQVPLDVILGNATRCRIDVDGTPRETQTVGRDRSQIRLKNQRARVDLRCPEPAG